LWITFSSFTELGHLPDWYEYAAAGEVPARPVREGELHASGTNGRLLGVWEFEEL